MIYWKTQFHWTSVILPSPLIHRRLFLSGSPHSPYPSTEESPDYESNGACRRKAWCPSPVTATHLPPPVFLLATVPDEGQWNDIPYSLDHHSQLCICHVPLTPGWPICLCTDFSAYTCTLPWSQHKNFYLVRPLP